jgi:hypothetical protein
MKLPKNGDLIQHIEKGGIYRVTDDNGMIKDEGDWKVAIYYRRVDPVTLVDAGPVFGQPLGPVLRKFTPWKGPK